jgi:hypothetical protein
MIWDCFTYFNEKEVTRIRFNELGDLVDRFVIVEASQTFTGQEKPLYFDEILDELEEWQHKIVRVVVDFPSNIQSAWDRESFQRQQIMQGLVEAKGGDLVVVSDADEIPCRNILSYRGSPIQLDVTQYFWNLNWQVPQHCNQGARPVIASRCYIKNPHELRVATLERIPRAGWHFSCLDTNKVAEKIEAFSHTEYNSDTFKSRDHIETCITLGIDPFNRFPLKYRAIDKTYPLWIQENQEMVKHLTILPPT